MLLNNGGDKLNNDGGEISSDDNSMDSSSTNTSGSDFFHDGATAPEFYVAFSLATWGAEGENLGNDEAEVVHAAWAIVDGKSGKVHSTHGSFVKPEDFSKISWENMEKHHIGELDVKNAFDLGQVIQQFDSRINALIYGRQVTDGLFNGHQQRRVLLAVDNPMTIRQVLHPEAARKGVRLPDYYWSFLNLKRWSCMDDESEAGCDENKTVEESHNIMNGVLTNGDIHHKTASDPKITNIQKCRHVAKIISDFISKNNSNNKGYLECFAKPEVVKPGLEHGICTKDDVIDNNTVIRARGLPWQSSDDDVAKFFVGLNIARGGVALVLSQLGRRNGEALVRFETQEQRDMALRRHRHFMGDRYIEVYRANGDDFLKIAAGTSDAAQQFLSLNEAVIVRMRGLPYDCTAEKIIEFFKTGENQISGDLDPEKDILFVNKIDGKATGDAFVRFSYKGDDVKALAKHKEVIGTRYIELFRSTTAEVQQVLNKTMEPLKQAQVELVCPVTAIPTVPAPTHCLLTNGVANGGGGAIPTIPQLVPGFLPPQQLLVGGSRKDCIRLRGLPYESQVQHILDFLGEYAKHVLLQGVHMVLNAQGHPSGEAFIQLDSDMAAAAAAADRHNKYMQIGKKQRYIEVFQCSADDMNLVLTGPTALQTSLITAANALQARPIMNPGANLFYPNAAALAAANLLPAHFFAQQQNPLAAAAQQQQQILGALQNGTLPGAQAAFPNVLAGAARLPIIPNFTTPLPTGMPSPGALVYWPYPSPPVSPSNYYAAAFVAQAAQQQPGVVLLRGLPLNVTVNEILALFQGYPEITSECVQIQRTPTGQATGEALVTFPNRFEAERAVLEKNRQILGARPVELFIYGI